MLVLTNAETKLSTVTIEILWHLHHATSTFMLVLANAAVELSMVTIEIL